VRLVLQKFVLTTEIQINIISFKVVPLGDDAPTSASSARIPHVEVPSDGLSRHLCVFHSSKMTTFEVELEFQVKEEVIRTQIRRVWGLRKHWSILFGKKFVHGDGSVTWSVVVMQYSSVRSLWSDTMNPLPESFKDLTIVLFINCLSLRHEFLMNNLLTAGKKTNWYS